MIRQRHKIKAACIKSHNQNLDSVAPKPMILIITVYCFLLSFRESKGKALGQSSRNATFYEDWDQDLAGRQQLRREVVRWDSLCLEVANRESTILSASWMLWLGSWLGLWLSEL